VNRTTLLPECRDVRRGGAGGDGGEGGGDNDAGDALSSGEDVGGAVVKEEEVVDGGEEVVDPSRHDEEGRVGDEGGVGDVDSEESGERGGVGDVLCWCRDSASIRGVDVVHTLSDGGGGGEE